MADKHMKKVSPSLVITPVRHHYSSGRMAKIKRADNTKCWQECGTTKIILHCWWEYKLNQSFWKSV